MSKFKPFLITAAVVIVVVAIVARIPKMRALVFGATA
jgi:hypothetical protein